MSRIRQDLLEGFLDAPAPVHPVEDAFRFVVGAERPGLFPVDPEALPDYLRPVVLPKNEGGAADVTDSFPGGLPGVEVIDRSTLQT